MPLETLENALSLFGTLLETGHFYEAHEALEPLWFPRRFELSAEVLLLKGFINAAVSFELYKRNRPLRSNQVWGTYQKYALQLLHVSPLHRPFYERANQLILKTRSRYDHF
jgi:hypothetical protein